MPLILTLLIIYSMLIAFHLPSWKLKLFYQVIAHATSGSSAWPCRKKDNTLSWHPGQLWLDPSYLFIASIQKSRKTSKYTHCLILQSRKAMIFIEMLSLFSFLDALLLPGCSLPHWSSKKWCLFFFTHWKSFIDKSILIWGKKNDITRIKKPWYCLLLGFHDIREGRSPFLCFLRKYPSNWHLEVRSLHCYIV